MKAVIMCGGKGSRLKPITENTPKPLIRLLNKPVIEHIIERLVEIGITEIYLSLGYKGNDIADYCDKLNVSAKLNFCFEDKPLGTAGGVKNCIKEDEGELLILSGDNIFDIDLSDFISFHRDSGADFSVCGVKADDPREYGIISCDDDSSIRCFIEKPTWEQAEGDTVNTGIYIMNGSILSMIPEECMYDFSDDLFPEIFKSNLRFMCWKTDAFWGDMGEFSSLRHISRAILENGCRGFNFIGELYTKDSVLDNGAAIIAPCVIGKDVLLGSNAVIGPYCVIGNDTKIGAETVASNLSIGSECVIGGSCELDGCFIDDNVTVKDNCLIENDAVLGFSCEIGRFSRVLAEKKVWTGRKIADETIVARDMLFENPESITFDVFGITAKANSQVSLSDIVLLGQAIASCKNISRVGVGSDSEYVSENFRSCLLSGLRACGATVYDFGEMFSSQSYFYSSYCNLDFFIFISTSGDVLSVSFFGKNGLPVDSSVARAINNNYKFSLFEFPQPSQYKEIFNMKLFNLVYKAFYKKLCPLISDRIHVTFESENALIKELADEIFSEKTRDTDKYERKIQFLLNINASELFVVEDGRVYSGERILALLCELECADGNDVIIGEEAPECIENNVSDFKGNVMRVYENSNYKNKYPEKLILNSIWTSDMFMLTAKLLNVLSCTGMSLEDLFECHKSFAVRKSVLELNENACEIRKKLSACGARRSSDNIYFVYEGNLGRVRMRQLGNSRKIRILAEADDMEAAKEISVFVAQKIKSHYVDKDK